MEGSPVLGNIYWRYRGEYNQYRNAVQATHTITYPTMNRIQRVVVGFSLFLLILILILNRTRVLVSHSIKVFFLLALIGLISNAITCASLSMVADRFQGRIIWLIPLFVFLTVSSIKWGRVTKS